ncbi:MAG: hypothetical protein AABY00_02515 [Nanoarchaeota archaeon]
MSDRFRTLEGLRIFNEEDVERFRKEYDVYTSQRKSFWKEKLKGILEKNKYFADYACTLASNVIHHWHADYEDKNELKGRLFECGFILPYISLGGLEEENFPLVSPRLIMEEQREAEMVLAVEGKEGAKRTASNQISQLRKENELILAYSLTFLSQGWYNPQFLNEGKSFTAITYDLIKKQAIEDRLGGWALQDKTIPFS